MPLASVLDIRILAVAVLIASSHVVTALSLLPAPGGPPAPNLEWDYSHERGPDQWGKLSREWHLCQDGMQQSPVDLKSSSKPAEIQAFHGGINTITSDYHWKPYKNMTMTHNGRTLEAKFHQYNAPSFTAMGSVYEIAQMHVHTPSEHRLDGWHADLELHLVGKQRDGIKLAVHGILFKVNSSSIAEEMPFWSSLPAILPKHKNDAATHWPIVQLDQLLAAVDGFKNAFTYKGSLTTPPCTEDVTWVVGSTVLPISWKVFDAIRDIIKFNSRHI